MSKRINPPIENHDEGLPSKGWGPFRYEWYSFCSGHSPNDDGNYYSYDINCPRCTSGSWTNCWLHEVGSWFHDNHYPLWFWWANRHQYSFREGIKKGREYKNAGY